MTGKHRRQPSQEEINQLTPVELERLEQALKDHEDFPPRTGKLSKDDEK